MMRQNPIYPQPTRRIANLPRGRIGFFLEKKEFPVFFRPASPLNRRRILKIRPKYY